MRRMYSKPQLLEAVEQESKLNGIKVFEDIKDKDGHARFIEGDITTTTKEGFEWTYSKWSLSGNHLMMVIAGNIANGTTWTSFNFGEVHLPEWIFNKIYKTFGNNIMVQGVSLYNADTSSQSIVAYIQKLTNYIAIYCTGATASKDRSFRITIDLLIDNE